ncbi:hypothetical protein SAMN05421761_11245 [Belliella pelovolcani]|uniref:Uncharacterized protein n=1 Tax=Belliella pelovolcani TaxID=529505 RepID=A0A1N7NWZ6_9BACT|nr:hypothetical protein SAMN05421761_11245 [Belliella pelovolcani]
MVFLFPQDSTNIVGGRDESPFNKNLVRNRPKRDSRGAVRHAMCVRVIPSSLLKANFRNRVGFFIS